MTPLPLADLLRQESATVEWKRGVADQADVVRTLTAFANAPAGSPAGCVLCGVDERPDADGIRRGAAVGLETSEAARIENTVLQQCHRNVYPPLQVGLEHVPASDPGRSVLVFRVAPSAYAHVHDHSKDGSFYWVRRGPQTVKALGAQLDELLRRKAARDPFLNRPALESTLADVDQAAAREALRAANLPHPPEEYLLPGARIDDLTPPLFVARPGGTGDEPVPTYLALLLFGHAPTRVIPGAFAVLSVYPGTARDTERAQRYELTGSLPHLVHEVLRRLSSHTGYEIDKSDTALAIRQNRPRYSDRALQEAVVNAFAHRDYESAEPVRITVLSDRIEIASPGGLVPGLDPVRVREGRAHASWRNHGLARFLLKTGLAQNEGQGIPTILRDTSAFAGRPAQIVLGDSDFVVVIPAYAPTPPRGVPTRTGGDAIVLVTLGAPSIRSAVEASLPALGLQGREIVVDFVRRGYVEVDALGPILRDLRDELGRCLEDPRYDRVHLFYRGPVVGAALIGALFAGEKPFVAYHYEEGHYLPTPQIDVRFLRSTD